MGQPGFRDLFSRDSAAYARFRPRYPPELFGWLAGLPEQRRTAWDCATGTGQAARLLRPHFPFVIGTDASRTQLRAAPSLPGVSYAACLGERAAISGHSIDLVTVAQAFHWLDHPDFYREVDRVIAPGGALAVIGYARLSANRELEEIIGIFQDETVGPYWTPERRLVDEGYQGVSIPIEEVSAPRFAIEASLTMDQLLGYVGTWSAVGRFREARHEDPMAGFTAALREVWGDPHLPRAMTWPLFIRAGRWRGTGT